jgi:hypothetical protein
MSLRQIIITEMIAHYDGFLKYRHITDTERMLAQLKIQECRVMLSEVEVVEA